MKELSKYNIDIYGLEDKQYVYEMESGDAFFEELEQDLIESGQFKTRIVMVKSSTMLQFTFHMEGTVGLICDRSLEPFEEAFESEERLILKFGDRDEELSDEIVLINRNTNRVNVARYIFEFIALALPYKKIHPDHRQDDDNTEFSQEDDEVILVYSSERAVPGADQEDAEAIDPRWAALKKLKGDTE
ncbi:YceD family protein [Dyadobacter tibetensis]|uniref:YceD family protein n=1 Tax=Dyadobacter tibetensis TaxID=1211851 RepID=UPI0004725B18|nr:DUF177 domain-containing protein [Dyadobacter tibetensis]